jgi:hypothetical protein
MLVEQRNAILLQVGELVRDLQQRSAKDADSVLEELTRNAAKFVPGAQLAGITVVGRKGAITTVAPTHAFVITLDDVQRTHGEGPCRTAGIEHQIIRIDDLSKEQRWPRYRDDAIRFTSVRSILSLQMFTDPKSTGALNFYAERTYVFDDESVELGLIFATHTALVWNLARSSEQFRSALASRDVIGQAKGMIMERFNVNAVEAFELLRKLSQTSNTPVAEVARRLVDAEHPLR